MALPTTGPMKASAIRTELKASGKFDINAANYRKLAKKPSGLIKFSDFRGKSDIVSKSFRLLTTRRSFKGAYTVTAPKFTIAIPIMGSGGKTTWNWEGSVIVPTNLPGLSFRLTVRMRRVHNGGTPLFKPGTFGTLGGKTIPVPLLGSTTVGLSPVFANPLLAEMKAKSLFPAFFTPSAHSIKAETGTFKLTLAGKVYNFDYAGRSLGGPLQANPFVTTSSFTSKFITDFKAACQHKATMSAVFAVSGRVQF